VRVVALSVVPAAAALESKGCPDNDWIVRHSLLEPLAAAVAMTEFESLRGA
jgi:hypothetical protein